MNKRRESLLELVNDISTENDGNLCEVCKYADCCREQCMYSTSNIEKESLEELELDMLNKIVQNTYLEALNKTIINLIGK